MKPFTGDEGRHVSPSTSPFASPCKGRGRCVSPFTSPCKGDEGRHVSPCKGDHAMKGDVSHPSHRPARCHPSMSKGDTQLLPFKGDMCCPAMSKGDMCRPSGRHVSPFASPCNVKRRLCVALDEGPHVTKGDTHIYMHNISKHI